MTELHWFRFYAKDWLSSPAVTMMTPEQRGAYVHLLALAWGDGSIEPSLPANDASLAQMSGLGPRWKKQSALIVEQFDRVGDRLVNAKLTDVWREGQEQHEKAVAKGRKGGLTKAERHRKSSSPASSPASSTAKAQLAKSSSPANSPTLAQGVAGAYLEPSCELVGGIAGAYQSGSGTTVELSPLRGERVLPVVAPDGALGPEGPRASGAEQGNTNGHSNGHHAEPAPVPDFGALLAATFPAETASRRSRERAEHEITEAAVWYAEHPEAADSIDAELATYRVSTDTGRDRMRTALVVNAWRKATGVEP